MKISQLTFTRFLAAVSIVIYHAHSNIYPFNLGFLKTIFNNANVGVSYFFVLSGFVMIIAYGKNKSIKIIPKSFYLNRVARIYPVYLIALALTIITRIKNDEIHFMNLSLQIFALQAWYPPAVLNLNSPGWSLSVEVLFYLTFPFIFNYFYCKYSSKFIFISVILLWIVTQISVNYLFFSSFYKGYPSNSHNLLFYFPFLHLNEFMVGNIVGYVYLRFSKQQRNFDPLITLVFILMLVLLSFKASVNYNDGLMAIVFAPLILLISLNNGKITKIFSNKYLIILGEASYSMYILQVPIQSFCYYIFKKLHFSDENGRFYIFLIILIIVSILCYYFIEIPAKDWIKSLKKSLKKAITKKAELIPLDDTINF
jgi:peptidoglycan/LPS O-acetylase OafA/YrhL